jgi:hypothetical protein
LKKKISNLYTFYNNLYFIKNFKIIRFVKFLKTKLTKEFGWIKKKKEIMSQRQLFSFLLISLIFGITIVFYFLSDEKKQKYEINFQGKKNI